MEGATGAVLGLCADGWGVGWLRGKCNNCLSNIAYEGILTDFIAGCLGPQIHRAGLPLPYAVLWGC